jgi:hypothetical protein
MKFMVKDDKVPEQKRQERVELEGVQDELYTRAPTGSEFGCCIRGARAPLSSSNCPGGI